MLFRGDQQEVGGIVRQYRTNERIRAREVRLIGETGEQMGVVPLEHALEIARERDTDLVEVAPSAVPPVCRLLDYGKFKYEQAKKEREAKKSQKSALLRQVRLRPKISGHDIDTKMRLIKKLLDEGDKVKVLVVFRAREITHPQLGRDLLERVSEALKESASIERPVAMEGRNMSVIFAPAAKQMEPRQKKKES